jgi:hypothetical protein
MNSLRWVDFMTTSSFSREENFCTHRWRILFIEWRLPFVAVVWMKTAPDYCKIVGHSTMASAVRNDPVLIR